MTAVWIAIAVMGLGAVASLALLLAADALRRALR